jgi:hypothetical protein
VQADKLISKADLPFINAEIRHIKKKLTKLWTEASEEAKVEPEPTLNQEPPRNQNLNENRFLVDEEAALIVAAQGGLQQANAQIAAQGRRHIMCGVYETPNGTIDLWCMKDTDKDFVWMLFLTVIMTAGVFIYALV